MFVQDEETEALLATDFEIGHFIRERVVPRAVLYFTGEALENDDVSDKVFGFFFFWLVQKHTPPHLFPPWIYLSIYSPRQRQEQDYSRGLNSFLVTE